jgi:hypothetical protein
MSKVLVALEQKRHPLGFGLEDGPSRLPTDIHLRHDVETPGLLTLIFCFFLKGMTNELKGFRLVFSGQDAEDLFIRVAFPAA